MSVVQITVYKDKSFDLVATETPPAAVHNYCEANKVCSVVPNQKRGKCYWDQIVTIADKMVDLNGIYYGTSN
jgi:ribosomal protein L11